MNRKLYRLVYSRCWGKVVAAAETAKAAGKAGRGETRGRRLRRAATFMAAASGLLALPALAQIAPVPGTSTHVIQTPDGLPQVNLAAPSRAGVSVNTYSRFDVQKRGAILNNSPVMVHTQQAGMINGNPNYGPGQSARIIVNQVNSVNPSQLRGFTEIAGNRAELVIANPSGIVVDGGGFINTSRATLTSGQPHYGADGSLAGFDVGRGRIAVQGAGLNAAGVDQVDLLARAVQVNAVIHAGQLNVVAGANRIDRATLATQAIAADGPAPDVSIDVSQLGGMYAERIRLVGTEKGVGVSSAGVLAAQAGGLALQSNGRLVLTGSTQTGGDLALSARDGIDNGGTTYGGRHVSVSTGGALSNGGTLAAQGDLDVTAGSVASRGTLGAGVDANGTAGEGGNLNVAAAGRLAATGTNIAGGHLTFEGGGIDLSASKTAAGATLTLRARSGELDLRGTTTSARGAIEARASGALLNDRGTLASQAGTILNGGSLSNRGGTVSAGGALSIGAGQVSNQDGTLVADGALTLDAAGIASQGGTIQGGGAVSVTGGSFDNTAGRLVSLNGDGLTLTTTGQLLNTSGTIGGNGDVTVEAGELVNHHGSLGAQQALSIAASRLDNREGAIAAQQLAVKAGDLRNARGTLTQYGDAATMLDVTGRLDNTQGGTIQTNGTDLRLAPASLDNAGGTILHAGTGTLTLAPAAGTLGNAGGHIESRGTVALSADALDNTGGTLTASGALAGRLAGELNNAQGTPAANGDVALDASSLTNTRGARLGGANVRIRTGRLNNDGGQIRGTDATLSATGAVSSAGGQIGATHDLVVEAGTLSGGGAWSAANDLVLKLQGDFVNTAHYAFNAGHDLSFTLPGTLTNDGALLGVNDLGVEASNIVNRGTMSAGHLLHTRSDTLANTGAMVGGSVLLAAASTLMNVGPTALIGASDRNGLLELRAQDIQNRDDTTATDTPALTAIYGLGRVVLAGGRDESGRYLNAANVLNQSGLIQSDGDMALHARHVTNTRRQMQTEWSAQVDAALLESLGISLAGRTGRVGVKDPDSIGGVYVEPPHGGEYNSTYQFTTYRGTALANVVTRISPQAQIVSGGNLDAASVEVFRNAWSAVTAAGDIALPARLDQDSWQGQTAPQLKVTYTGEYHYRNYDGSKPDWTISFCDAPRCRAPSDVRRYGLPAYESSFVANGTLSGTGVNIDNPAGNATLPPIGLPPGAGTGAIGGGMDPVVAGATAVDVLKHLTIPQGGLFHPQPAPEATYLIETNPAFAGTRQFLSSDYYLQQLGLKPDQTQKRLGDGFYEQWLVRNQLTALTGKAVPGPYADAQSMYEALLGAGATLAKSLDLPLGASLSADQVKQLMQDVVLMETRVVDGQSVLVPVVYLAKAGRLEADGPLIAGGDIDLKNVQSFSNSGTVSATHGLSLDARQIDSRFGALLAGGQMTLATTGTVDLTSARLKAGALKLDAGGDLVLDAATQTRHQVNAAGATRSNTTLVKRARIDVADDASIAAGGDFRQNAGHLAVGGNLDVKTGGDWMLGAQETGEHKVAARMGGVSDTDIRGTATSSVRVGGASSIAVGRDLTARGARIDLREGGTIVAGGDVTLGAAGATSMVNSSSAGSSRLRSYAETFHSSDQQLEGTVLTGGDSVAIVAGKDLNVSGSAIRLDKGNATLAATGDVNLGAATETHALDQHETHSRSGVVNGSKVASGLERTSTVSRGSLISADGVTIAGGRDIRVSGSSVVGTNDVTLKAGRDVRVATSRDTTQSSSYYQKKETGVMSNGGLSVSVGSRSTSDKQQETGATNDGSAVGSLDGNLAIRAGNAIHASGSVLHAGNDVNLAARTVNIEAVADTSDVAQQQQFRQSGLTVALSNPVVSAVQTGRQMANAAQNVSGDARLMALAAVTTGLAAKNTWDAVKSMGGNPLAAATSVGVNVSVGSSRSDSQMRAQSATATGSTVSAGRDVTIAATGAGADSRIDVTGGTVSAGRDATLAAQGSVNLQAAQSTGSQHGKNSGSGASLGVSFTVGGNTGPSLTAGVSGSRGHADGDSTTWTNTHVNAGNRLAIQSGGDTNLKGAVASGRQVTADVGGDLNIESLQNLDRYDSRQQSAGVSVSVCPPPCLSSVAGSVGQTKMNSDYASVIEQSGIRTTDGGFQVDVRGNTDLKGAVIASDDSAVREERNRLTTGTLTHGDIANHAKYDASQVAVSGGYGGAIGKDQKGKADNVNPVPGTELPKEGGFSFAPPVALGASGDADSLTRSAVSGGALRVTDDAKQREKTGQTAQEATAGLNRDTSDTEGALAPIFDREKIQAGFEITSQFVNQVGTFVANRANEIDGLKRAARDPDARDANGDPLTGAQREQMLRRADDLEQTWGPGKPGRRALTALTAAAGGNVTGGAGQFAANAAVGYVQGLAASQVKALADSLGRGTPQAESVRAALHAIAGCAGAAAASQGCGAGAMGAASSSLIGWALGPADGLTERERQARVDLVKGIVSGMAVASGLDASTAGNAAQLEVENNQLSILAPKKNPLTVDLLKTFCATGTCTDGQVTQLVQAQNQINEANGRNAVTAATAAAIVAAVPALLVLGPEALALALSNPAAAVNAGIITVETAAAIATNSVTPGVVVEGAGPKGIGAADAGNIRNVNPTGSMQNCTNCVAIVDNLLTTGNEASALPRSTPVPFYQLGNVYGTTFSGWTTQASIESSLLAGGNGTRAVIYGTDGVTGHVWNAIVQNGKVNYIDGQIGAGGAINFQTFSNFQFGILP